MVRVVKWVQRECSGGEGRRTLWEPDGDHHMTTHQTQPEDQTPRCVCVCAKNWYYNRIVPALEDP